MHFLFNGGVENTLISEAIHSTEEGLRVLGLDFCNPPSTGPGKMWGREGWANVQMRTSREPKPEEEGPAR